MAVIHSGAPEEQTAILKTREVTFNTCSKGFRRYKNERWLRYIRNQNSGGRNESGAQVKGSVVESRQTFKRTNTVHSGLSL